MKGLGSPGALFPLGRAREAGSGRGARGHAFSKKLANLEAAVALHFTYYNFVRVHQTLRVTSAMEVT